MDIDQGGRQLAGLILDTVGRGEHDHVAGLIAPLDAEQQDWLVPSATEGFPAFGEDLTSSRRRS